MPVVHPAALSLHGLKALLHCLE